MEGDGGRRAGEGEARKRPSGDVIPFSPSQRRRDSSSATGSVGIPGDKCDGTLLPTLFEASMAHSKDYNGPHSHPLDGSKDIFLYVAVVMVFYVLIVLIILGARYHQKRYEAPPEEPQHLVLYDDLTNTTVQADSRLSEEVAPSPSCSV
ncbi:unnamed protein product [Darwinula stevensoni]|uniref:Uncharacterized protein n=1 Tax=Darwinula stevensoni TaxID=69355 RepID=A0A7R9A2L9_9CRUS|nr:unnamed protein product [Darwinula stevensoni]CAG0885946.1 unnamed protein product [Darwinula stevensoni]